MVDPNYMADQTMQMEVMKFRSVVEASNYQRDFGSKLSNRSVSLIATVGPFASHKWGTVLEAIDFTEISEIERQSRVAMRCPFFLLEKTEGTFFFEEENWRIVIVNQTHIYVCLPCYSFRL